MHRYPSVPTHLQAIRECLVHVADEEAREYGAELIERLEIYIRFRKLTGAMMLEALGAFRDVPGADASIEALEALASSAGKR